MTYDFHGNWETATGINSPLYANPQFDKNDNVVLNTVRNVIVIVLLESSYDRKTQNWSVNYWISQGFPANRINLGMPLYAQGWTLANTANNGINALAYSGVTPGPYTQQSGIWGYNEVIANIHCP